MHVEANQEDNNCTVFDDSGDCSLANLRLAHNRLESCKYTNIRVCDDPKPVLCKIMNLIELVPQNYLKSFTECLLRDLNDMREFDVVSLELVYSNQVRLKRYSFLRSNSGGSDGFSFLPSVLSQNGNGQFYSEEVFSTFFGNSCVLSQHGNGHHASC